MRIEGVIKSWNEERGFGFIEPVQGGQEIFVHAKAFRAGSGRPQVGQYVSFAIEIGPQGKKRAKEVELIRVARVTSERRDRLDAPERGVSRPRAKESPSSLRTGMVKLVFVAVVAVIGWQAYGRFHEHRLASMEVDEPVATRSVPLSSDKSVEASNFRCDGRTHCSQMTSCAEATFFIRNCPGTKMDGDGDGIPCESQHC